MKRLGNFSLANSVLIILSIGWISANPSDLTGCPSGPCTATLTNCTVSGWLRALSGNTSQSGGWDGFISLSGSNYGITELNGTFSGYAWGDMNVGWIDSEYAHYASCTPTYSCSGNTIQYENSSCQVSNVATCVAPQFCSTESSSCLAPTILFNSSGGYTGHLQVVPRLVRPGEPVQVYWNVSDAQSCSVTGSNGDSWSGLSSPSGGETSKPISSQTTYTLSYVADSGATPPSITEEVQVDTTPVYHEI